MHKYFVLAGQGDSWDAFPRKMCVRAAFLDGELEEARRAFTVVGGWPTVLVEKVGAEVAVKAWSGPIELSVRSLIHDYLGVFAEAIGRKENVST